MNDQIPLTDLPELLTAREVAEYLRTTEAALAQWRCRGRGPAYRKLSTRVRYRAEDVRAWVENGATG